MNIIYWNETTQAVLFAIFCAAFMAGYGVRWVVERIDKVLKRGDAD